MTYHLCKRLIEAGKTFGLVDKLDVFLLNNRITEEQYNELISLMNEEEENHGK